MLIARHHKLPSFDSIFLGRIVWLQLPFWFISNPLLISFAVGSFLVIVFICVGINLSLVFIIVICSKNVDGSWFFIYLPVDVKLLNWCQWVLLSCMYLNWLGLAVFRLFPMEICKWEQTRKKRKYLVRIKKELVAAWLKICFI